MIVVMVVVAWLVLCAVAAVGYVFGATVGIRRGMEQAGAAEDWVPEASRRTAGRQRAVVVRLPEEANRP